MKRFFVAIIFFPFLVFAQDGSSAARVPVSGGVAATSSAPRAVPEIVTPSPVPITPPELSTEPEPVRAPYYKILGLASAVALAAGAYVVLRMKTKKSKPDEKKNEQSCLNLKKLMEDKLKELTDLKGSWKRKQKEWRAKR